MSNLSARNKEYMVILVIVCVCAFMAKVVYDRQIAQCALIGEKINEEKQKGAALERIVLLGEKIKKIKAEKSWDTPDSSAIVDKIFNFGFEAQVKIKNISPGEKKEEKNYLTVPLVVTCETTYKNLLKFIKKCEGYKMFVRIKDIAMRPLGPQEAQGADPLLGVNLSVEAVYFK